MKIDTNAFMNSLPIMGVGLLGIFIVTIVIILGIYILKALTTKTADSASSDKNEKDTADQTQSNTDIKKESAMDLMKEREKKDFLKEVENNYISQDL